MKQRADSFSQNLANAEILNASFKRILEHTDSMVFVKNADLVYLAASVPFLRMTGRSSMDAIIGHTDFEVFEDQALAKRYTDDDRKLLSSGKDMPLYIEPITDSQGMYRYSATSKYILRDPEGAPIGIIGISRDITQDYISRRFYQQELKFLFELPLDTYAALFMDVDDWRIIRHNHHAVGGRDVRPQETMESFIENAIQCLADPVDNATRSFYQRLSREMLNELAASGKRTLQLEYLREMPNGENRWVHVEIHFMVDPESGHLCAIWSMQDIDAKKQETIDLIHAAERDHLTGLYNRASTMKQIQKTLEERSEQTHALYMIDVDNFKKLNDSLGHQAGDKFLVDFSVALQGCFQEKDIVGRIGGDEFFVLLKNATDEKCMQKRAESLLNAIQVVCADYSEQELSVSIGISVYPVDGEDLVSLYGKADVALYQAKQRGKNQFVFASPQSI